MKNKTEKNKKNKKSGTKNKHINVLKKNNTFKLATSNYKKHELSKLYKTVDLPSSLSKNKKSKKIKKVLRFGKTTVKNYILYSSEKIEKKEPPTNINECYYTDRDTDFPCKYQYTIFNTIDEYNEYKKMKDARNAVTGYKHRSMHYDEILGNSNRIQTK